MKGILSDGRPGMHRKGGSHAHKKKKRKSEEAQRQEARIRNHDNSATRRKGPRSVRF